MSLCMCLDVLSFDFIQELEVWHHQRIALLYEAGLRLFACETIPAQVI